MAAEEKISNVIFFTKENAVFYKTPTGFTAMKAFIPPVELIDEDNILETDMLAEQPFAPHAGGPHGSFPPPPGAFHGGPHNKDFHRGIKRQLYSPDGEKKWQDLGRVYFHRAFPFDHPDRYISVMDKESNEYGMILDLGVFDDETVKIINESLDRKYYLPEIHRIYEIKEQFGYSHWTVDIDDEKREFSVRDTFKSIIRVNDCKVLVLDCDGNRFLISDIEKLDPKSYRKIEIYL